MSELKIFELIANTVDASSNDRAEELISMLEVDIQNLIHTNNDLELRKRLSSREVFTDSISVVLKKDNHIV